MQLAALRCCLDLYVNPGRQRQLIKRVDRLSGWLNDIDHPFVRSDLKLLA